MEVILQAGCWWRLTLGEVEIGVGWISFAGDRRCLDSVRGREWRDGEGFLLVCLVIAGE